MTNRELLQKALPLVSLTEKQWNAISNHIKQVKKGEVATALETLISNQAKIEVAGNYLDYYPLNEKTRIESVPIMS